MGMKAEYHGTGKLNTGPGGIACPCCGWGRHPRKVKPEIRRYVRRKGRQQTHQLILDQDNADEES